MITTLTIKFDTETKQIKVEGLLDDTLLMLGLLEMAKLTLIERRAKTSNVIDIGGKNVTK